METAFGGPLTWEPKEGMKATKISSYTEVADVAQQEHWDAWIDWMISTSVKMRAAVDAVGGIPLI